MEHHSCARRDDGEQCVTLTRIWNGQFRGRNGQHGSHETGKCLHCHTLGGCSGGPHVHQLSLFRTRPKTSGHVRCMFLRKRASVLPSFRYRPTTFAGFRKRIGGRISGMIIPEEKAKATVACPKKPRATKRRGRHPDKALSAAFLPQRRRGRPLPRRQRPLPEGRSLESAPMGAALGHPWQSRARWAWAASRSSRWPRRASRRSPTVNWRVRAATRSPRGAVGGACRPSRRPPPRCGVRNATPGGTRSTPRTGRRASGCTSSRTSATNTSPRSRRPTFCRSSRPCGAPSPRPRDACVNGSAP